MHLLRHLLKPFLLFLRLSLVLDSLDPSLQYASQDQHLPALFTNSTIHIVVRGKGGR